MKKLLLVLVFIPYISLAQEQLKDLSKDKDNKIVLKCFVAGDYLSQKFLSANSITNSVKTTGYDIGGGIRTMRNPLFGAQLAAYYTGTNLVSPVTPAYFDKRSMHYFKISPGIVGDDPIGRNTYFHYGADANIWLPVNDSYLRNYTSVGINAGLGFSCIMIKLSYEVGLSTVFSHHTEYSMYNLYPPLPPKTTVNTLSIGVIIYPSGL